MILLILLLLIQLPTQSSLNTTWALDVGNDFFVEESQRHLIQVTGDKKVTSYFDVTYLWHYQIRAKHGKRLEVVAELEKVRVNNPTEAGAKPSELLRQMKPSKSTWLFSPTTEGWQCEPVGKPNHAPPFLLLLGSRATDPVSGWKQTWKQTIPDQGSLLCHLELIPNASTSTSDRLRIRTAATLERHTGNNQKGKDISKPQAIPGIGEFDKQKSRWLYFEVFAKGEWQHESTGSHAVLKHDIYCSYRSYDRRPSFP